MADKPGHITQPHKPVHLANCATQNLMTSTKHGCFMTLDFKVFSRQLVMTSTKERQVSTEPPAISNRTTEIFLQFLKLTVKYVH